MSVQITYFVHGTTTDNEQGRSTGWLHGDLSELGIQQAKELGKLMADTHFDAIFCSDLKRAVDSAKLGFGATYQVIQDARLRECNYGDFNGLLVDELKDEEKHIRDAFLNGESFNDVERRISSFLEYLKRRYDGKHVAIVAHRFPQLALDVLLNGRTWEQALDEDWRKTKEWKSGWEYQLSI